MQRQTFGSHYTRFYAWLLWLGRARALALITLIATTTSVLVTALVMALIPGPSEFFWYGMIVAVVSPVVSAPGLGLLAITMVYHLNTAQTALAVAADTDALTGIANRRAFMIRAELAFAEARQSGRPFAVVMIDIDHFKAINDTFGHGVGDDVIHDVARVCQDALRSTDCFARFGGDEFVALLSATDSKGATAVAEILRKTVANLAFEGSTPQSVTVSVGVAAYAADSPNLHDILHDADRQLYAAKAAGRNQVMTGAEPAREAG